MLHFNVSGVDYNSQTPGCHPSNGVFREYFQGVFYIIPIATGELPDQIPHLCLLDRFMAAVHIQFIVDVADMHFDRSSSNKKFFGDFKV